VALIELMTLQDRAAQKQAIERQPSVLPFAENSAAAAAAAAAVAAADLSKPR
jgi:hypothetical protein